MPPSAWVPIPWSDARHAAAEDRDRLGVWKIRLPEMGGQAPAYAAALTGEERERAARITVARERELHVAGRALARTLVAARMGCAATEIHLDVGRWGKPAVRHPPGAPGFNVAHSGRIVLVAVGRVDVGVDVERRRERSDIAGMAERFYTPPEASRLRDLPAASRLDGFLILWARKEAVLKAAGLPVIAHSRAVCVLSDVGRGHVVVPDRDDRVAYWLDLPIDEGYVAAVATIGGPPEPLLREVVYHPSTP